MYKIQVIKWVVAVAEMYYPMGRWMVIPLKLIRWRPLLYIKQIKWI